MSHFIHYVDDPEWGSYYELTKGGYIGIVAIMILTIIVCAIFVSKKQQAQKMNIKSLAFAGILLALAFVTSYLKLELPMGGSVTLFSMFFVCYIGYLYGIKVGFIAAFAYSLLQFIQSGGTYFLSPFQVCCDYFFAFTALGISGFWYQKKKGLAIGYTVACIIRGLFHTIGGYMYWMDYMPDWFPKVLTNFYSIIYNYSYILVEMIVTLIIITKVKAVTNALSKIESQVRNDQMLPDSASKKLS